MNNAVSLSQNWKAYLGLKLRAGVDKTVMIPVSRYGPLSVQRAFYPEADTCHVYLLHPPGGVVGGDQLELDIGAESKARSLITTPGATKFYFSAGKTANVTQKLTLQNQATVEFLPQENIYFPGAIVDATTHLDVSRESVAILWEKHCFGRPVNDEQFSDGEVKLTLEVAADGKLLLTEKQRIDFADIQRASGLRGSAVVGTLLVYGVAMTSELVSELRMIVPETGVSGITRITETLTVIRYMGQSTQHLNAYFITLWTLLRPAMVQRGNCIPRIWNT